MNKNSNIIKDTLLGMSHGTANNQLRKMILFNCIQKLGEDICFRCGKKIEHIADLSIEHKESWQLSKTPKKTFFDLGNIAFSHLDCNISSANRSVPHFNGRGENSHTSKLTWKQVEEIRGELDRGRTLYSLSKEYNIDERSIAAIRDEKTWKI